MGYGLCSTWLHCDWYPGNDALTNAQRWLRSAGRTAPAALARIVASADAEPLSFYQVHDVDRARGLHLWDILTHEDRYVLSRAYAELLERGVLLFGRLVDVHGVLVFHGAAPIVLAPHAANLVWSNLPPEIRAAGPPATKELVRRNSRELLQLYMDFATEKISLSSGAGKAARVYIARLWIHEGRRDSVVARLDTLALERQVGGDDPIEWRWMEPAPGKDDSLSTRAVLQVAGDELGIYAGDAERRDRARGEIERVCDGLVDHVTSTDQVASEIRGTLGPRPPDLPEWKRGEDPLLTARRLLARYYTGDWADMCTPDLGGLSPRDCVRTPGGPARVETLIRKLEEEIVAGVPARTLYDFGQVRKALRLPAPGRE